MAAFAVVLLAASLPAQDRLDRYALFLPDPPLVEAVKSSSRTAAPEHRQRLAQAQQAVRSALTARRIRVLGSVDTLLNAVFVQATPEQAATLERTPGVARVQRLRLGRRHQFLQPDPARLRAAWDVVGGETNAGTGIRIGILDTGIDHNHPAFQDPSLQPPTRFSDRVPNQTAYTNNKVIVAKSFVDQLVRADRPRESRPDDLTPRDRDGHGTAAAMLAAGVAHSSPLGDVAGVAPKAFLGNYKIFGSPGVNDLVDEDVAIRALEEAFDDDMDVVLLALGFPAFFGPLQEGCANGPCDPIARAVDTAIRNGMVVVVSAGNSDSGAKGTIESPGTVPAAITVGASTAGRVYTHQVRLADSDPIPAAMGNGRRLVEELTAPLRDVTRLGDDGRACSALPDGSLAGAIALIQRGTCNRDLKVINAQRAGAVGVVLYQLEGIEEPLAPEDLGATGIPTFVIGYQAGTTLKDRVANQNDVAVTLDPRPLAVPREVDTLSPFSAQGPSLGEFGIKPDLVAPGLGLSVATQRLDANGSLYHPSGFTIAQGTSFAAAIVAGAAALVVQRLPASLGRDVALMARSAIVNTADAGVRVARPDAGSLAPLWATGAGRLNAESAVRTTVAAVPATLSVGVLRVGGAVPSNLPVQLLNLTNLSQRLTMRLVALSAEGEPQQPSPPLTFTLPPSSVDTVRISLPGTGLRPGAYQGFMEVTGGTVPLRLPYLYIVGDNVPAEIYPLAGSGFTRIPGGNVPGNFLIFKVVDRYGAPVVDAPVTFRVEAGGGTLSNILPRTDNLGISEARAVLGNTVGEQRFSASVGDLTVQFIGRTRPEPIINDGGVVSAASQRNEQAYAPGSLISIRGAGFGETTRTAETPLPLSLAGVSVSFDAATRDSLISLPGRIVSVSPERVDVQIPWELRGLRTVAVKVRLGAVSTRLVDVPLAESAPAVLESGEGRAQIVDEAGQPISSDNPARRGQLVTVYALGLGPVDNPPATGEPSPGDPLIRGVRTPPVTLGGATAEVASSNLAPGQVGVWALSFRVPADAPGGAQELRVSLDGQEARPVTITVE